FLTGCTRLPYHLEGFKMTIHKVRGGEHFLPSAHTCVNMLDLPDYSDKETLKSKLYMAIKETDGFGLV
ncbi:MAG: putative E3 ubiquitin-protein ligase herc4, partial [Paramarteilia canceri]